tara:strand:+ start:629 stop:892 length:264 start_codon:yes stop_codon:yes gene_type:complete
MLKFIETITIITKFKLQKVKPTMHRSVGEKGEQGWFVRIGEGGKSGEALMRVNMGKRVSYFPVYNRNGKTRINTYVPIKDKLLQVKA